MEYLYVSSIHNLENVSMIEVYGISSGVLIRRFRS